MLGGQQQKKNTTLHSTPLNINLLGLGVGVLFVVPLVRLFVLKKFWRFSFKSFFFDLCMWSTNTFAVSMNLQLASPVPPPLCYPSLFMPFV